MNGRKIAFGLGSNVGAREMHLAQARHALTALAGELQASHIDETPALLPEEAPEAWNIRYLNQVVMGRITEERAQHPEALLRAIKESETRLGRQDRGHWAPREVDIDIIAIEGVVYQSAILTLPHPQAHLRTFVLKPLVALWPDCVLAGGIRAMDAWEAHKKTVQKHAENTI
jgi:2-amino-4-hydroxy-6-hydroxymethyldihydropteridine diphosphokinase